MVLKTCLFTKKERWGGRVRLFRGSKTSDVCIQHTFKMLAAYTPMNEAYTATQASNLWFHAWPACEKDALWVRFTIGGSQADIETAWVDVHGPGPLEGTLQTLWHAGVHATKAEAELTAYMKVTGANMLAAGLWLASTTYKGKSVADTAWQRICAAVESKVELESRDLTKSDLLVTNAEIWVKQIVPAYIPEKFTTDGNLSYSNVIESMSGFTITLEAQQCIVPYTAAHTILKLIANAFGLAIVNEISDGYTPITVNVYDNIVFASKSVKLNAQTAARTLYQLRCTPSLYEEVVKAVFEPDGVETTQEPIGCSQWDDHCPYEPITAKESAIATSIASKSKSIRIINNLCTGKKVVRVGQRPLINLPEAEVLFEEDVCNIKDAEGVVEFYNRIVSELNAMDVKEQALLLRMLTSSSRQRPTTSNIAKRCSCAFCTDNVLSSSSLIEHCASACLNDSETWIASSTLVDLMLKYLHYCEEETRVALNATPTLVGTALSSCLKKKRSASGYLYQSKLPAADELVKLAKDIGTRVGRN